MATHTHTHASQWSQRLERERDSKNTSVPKYPYKTTSNWPCCVEKCWFFRRLWFWPSVHVSLPPAPWPVPLERDRERERERDENSITHSNNCYQKVVVRLFWPLFSRLLPVSGALWPSCETKTHTHMQTSKRPHGKGKANQSTTHLGQFSTWESNKWDPK